MQEQKKKFLKELYHNHLTEGQIDYNSVLASSNNKQQTKFVLMELEEEGLIQTKTYYSVPIKRIYLTKKALKEINAKEYDVSIDNKTEQKIFNKDRQKLINYLLLYGYDIEQKDGRIVARKGFGRYIIVATPNINKKKIDFHKINKETKSMLFFVTSIEDKTALQNKIQKWIFEEYSSIDSFFQEGNGYAVFSITDLENFSDFPRKIPTTANLYEIYKNVSTS